MLIVIMTVFKTLRMSGTGEVNHCKLGEVGVWGPFEEQSPLGPAGRVWVK